MSVAPVGMRFADKAVHFAAIGQCDGAEAKRPGYAGDERAELARRQLPDFHIDRSTPFGADHPRPARRTAGQRVELVGLRRFHRGDQARADALGRVELVAGDREQINTERIDAARLRRGPGACPPRCWRA